MWILTLLLGTAEEMTADTSVQHFVTSALTPLQDSAKTTQQCLLVGACCREVELVEEGRCFVSLDPLK